MLYSYPSIRGMQKDTRSLQTECCLVWKQSLKAGTDLRGKSPSYKTLTYPGQRNQHHHCLQSNEKIIKQCQREQLTRHGKPWSVSTLLFIFWMLSQTVLQAQPTNQPTSQPTNLHFFLKKKTSQFWLWPFGGANVVRDSDKKSTARSQCKQLAFNSSSSREGHFLSKVDHIATGYCKWMHRICFS